MGGGQLRALLPPGTFSHLRALSPPKKTRLRQTEPCDWWVGTPSAQPGGGWSGQHLAGLQPPILRAPLPPITGRARVGTHGSMQATLVIV